MKKLLTGFGLLFVAGCLVVWGQGSANNTLIAAVGSITCTQATPCASSFTTFGTSGASALYRMNASANCTTSGAAATVILALRYTDASSTVQTVTLATATCTTLGSASIAGTDQPVNMSGSTSIQYQVTVANAPSYVVRITVFQESAN